MSVERQPLVPRSQARGQRRRRGFSLIEVGIVLAVIAVLAAVVVTGAGFIRASKEQTTVTLVLSIREAARQFSIRNLSGLSYGTSASQALGNVTMKGLQGEAFLPTNITTPWDTTTVNTILVEPKDGAPPSPCAGFACVRIAIPVPSEECAGDRYLETTLKNKAVSVTCIGTTLEVVMR